MKILGETANNTVSFFLSQNVYSFYFFGIKELNKAYKLIVYDSAYLQGEGLLSLI